MPRLETATLTRTITADALAHPTDLVPVLAARYQVSRATVHKALKRLTEFGWLTRSGKARPVWAPGTQREVTTDYALAGLDEHTPWRHDIHPVMALSPTINRLAQHIFGELLNNAIDHSAGTHVTVSVRQTPTHLHLLICDNGIGIFDQLAQRTGLAEPARAALELAKGRMTTQPQAHGGRGIYFVARMVDAMNVQANGQVLQWRQHGETVTLKAHPRPHPGTTVFISLDLRATHKPNDVYASHGSEDAPLSFERTQVPLRLLTDGGLTLDSRAQARWVCSRLELFAHAELDFDGVAEVGPSFIDEVWRVWHGAHPQVKLTVSNVDAEVARLLGSVAQRA